MFLSGWLPVGESRVLKSLTIIVWGLMYDLNFSNVSFMNVEPLCLGHRYSEFRYNPGGFIFSLMNMKCPSPSLLITFGWIISIFLNIRTSTPVCFLGPFVWKIFFPALYSEIITIFVTEVCFLSSRMMDSVYPCTRLVCHFILVSLVL